MYESKLVIFDLDGTLVDSLPGIYASLQRTLGAHGLPGHSLSAVKSFVGDGVKTLIQRAAPVDVDAVMLRSLLDCFQADYRISWHEGTSPYDGIHEVLCQLLRDGYQLAVLSNKVHQFTVEMVHALFSEISFSQIVGHKEGFAPKPDPASILQIMSELQADPQHSCMVGDSTMDIQTAKKAGMYSVGVSWGYHDEQRLVELAPDSMISIVSDLPRAIDYCFR
jgi:phosphoglycolate phosphatase